LHQHNGHRPALKLVKIWQ